MGALNVYCMFMFKSVQDEGSCREWMNRAQGEVRQIWRSDLYDRALECALPLRLIQPFEKRPPDNVGLQSLRLKNGSVHLRMERAPQKGNSRCAPRSCDSGGGASTKIARHWPIPGDQGKERFCCVLKRRNGERYLDCLGNKVVR